MTAGSSCAHYASTVARSRVRCWAGRAGQVPLPPATRSTSAAAPSIPPEGACASTSAAPEGLGTAHVSSTTQAGTAHALQQAERGLACLERGPGAGLARLGQSPLYLHSQRAKGVHVWFVCGDFPGRSLAWQPCRALIRSCMLWQLTGSASRLLGATAPTAAAPPSAAHCAAAAGRQRAACPRTPPG